MRSINRNLLIAIPIFFIIFNSFSAMTITIQHNLNSENKLEIEQVPSAAVNANINAWIIVAGDRESDHELYDCIENGCQEVYDILIGLGYSSDNLYFLASDHDPPLTADAQAVSNKVNIQYAIETWAAGKVSTSSGLGIFLFDHGGTNKMCIPGPDLWDSELNTYLDNLEVTTSLARTVIVYEACHAGSFINPVSKANRIIVCATDSAHSSYPTADLSTAVFTEAFWSSISVGYSIGEAFENAKANVDAAGLGDWQKPWIDDNHDELGHTVDPWGHLPYFGDGNDALNLHIEPPLLILAPWLYIITPLPIYIENTAPILPLWCLLSNNDSKIEYVKARIFPPGWVPPEPEHDTDPDEGCYYFPEGGYADSFFDVHFQITPSLEPGSFNFSMDIRKRMNEIFGASGEGRNGKYGISFMAKTNGSIAAKTVTTTVTINEDGVAPADIIPPTITITNPASNNELSSIINITAEGNDDQALDKIQILLDGTLLNETTMPSYIPYPEAKFSLNSGSYTNGLHNITAIAIDEAGNREQTTVLVNFKNNVLFNFDYQPYLIGAVVGVGLTAVGQLILKRKRK